MDTLNFHGMMIQNTENDPEMLKFEALCTETCKRLCMREAEVAM